MAIGRVVSDTEDDGTRQAVLKFTKGARDESLPRFDTESSAPPMTRLATRRFKRSLDGHSRCGDCWREP